MMPGPGDRLQRLVVRQELDRRDGDAVAALGVDAGRRADQALHLLELLVHAPRGGALAERGQQRLRLTTTAMVRFSIL